MTTRQAASAEQKNNLKTASKFATVLDDDIKTSNEFLGDIEDDQVSSTIKKLSTFICSFEDILAKYEQACETLAGSLESNTKDLETLLEKNLDRIIACTRKASELKCILQDLKERKSELSAKAAPVQSESNPLLSNQIEQLLKVHSETQQQTQQLFKLQQDQLKHVSSSAAVTASQSNSVRLPKLSLPSYDGDVLKYKEFRDLFYSTVDSSKLSPVEKLAYLKDCLKGKALDAVSGLHITDDNYCAALDILEARFGDTQAAIHSHYMAIMHLPPATNKTSSLRVMYDQLEEHFRSLSAGGQDTEQDVFVAMIYSKLPQHTLLQLELHREAQEWSVQSLRRALGIYIKAKENSERHGASSNTSDNSSHDKKHTSKPTVRNFHASNQTLLTTDSKAPTCHFCSKNHYSDECRTYTTIAERESRIHDRCTKCMRRGHTHHQCKSKRPCFHCSEISHHRSLCPHKFSGSSASALNVSAEHVADVPSSQESVLIKPGNEVLMETAVAQVKSPGQSASARFLFDTGSSRSYISTTLYNKLKPAVLRKDHVSTSKFGSTKRTSDTLPIISLEVVLADGSNKPIELSVTPTISCPIKKSPLDLNKHPSLKKVKLAEPVVDKLETINIDILIGGDYYHEFVLPDRITFPDGLILLDSILGFICAGKIGRVQSQETQSFLLSCENDEDSNIQQLWSLDEVGLGEPAIRTADQAAHEQFQDSIEFTDQRYVVRWPWKDEPFNLQDDFGLAFGRLRSLLNRLHHQPSVLSKYNNVLADQLNQGIIEEVDLFSSDSQVHYLPHHCVVKDNNSTTKLRLVYDASAKSSRQGNSLNDCLYRGPVLLPDLCGVLLRFRLFPVAVCSDVEKAFLQIGLHTLDRDVTRFLWVRDIDSPLSYDNLVIYRFCRVPFGVISSPFLLAATLQHHLESSGSPEADEILRNTYVDNVVMGKPSVEEGRRFYSHAKELFASASMNLREWASNSDELMNSIPEADWAKSDHQKILGMDWSTKQDILSISNKNPSTLLVRSKRELLQAVAQFFDPLGFHAPLVTTAKLLLQDCWKSECSWDDRLSDSILARWNELACEMDKACSATFPRYCSQSGNVKHSLHVFCDASESAYAACAYLRTESETNVTSHLIFSKSKLAPIKKSSKLTIPRMELLAAAIGANIITFLKSQLHLTFDRVCLWSDSTCVLGWISSDKSLPSFIERRVSVIRQSVAEFRYVPTKDNPADLPSRGSSLHLSESEKLWWHGPEWLRSTSIPEPEFPGCPPDLLVSEPQVADSAMAPLKKKGVEVSPLKKKGEAPASQSPHVLLLVGEGPSEKEKSEFTSPFGIEATNISSLSKLLRVTAWCQRFVDKLKKKPCHAEIWLSASELQSAAKQWVRCEQLSHYRDVIQCLRKNKPNNTVRSLNVKLDDDGLLRAHGRLQHSPLEEHSRAPLLLPPRSWFVSLVVMDSHIRLMHSGVSHTLSHVRRWYWIPKGRSTVKSVVKACKVCRIAEGGPFSKPPMAPLPPERVTPADAFQYTGVDYFGPVFVKDTDRQTKAWVCLFTCLVTRAVHLELVNSMSTDHFLLAFRRFAARRGFPLRMLSDNAPQFKLAKSALESAASQVINDPETLNYLSSHNIQWSLIVEHAPWMGGVYERMVGIVKRCLRKSIGRRYLSTDQLTTVLAEAEAVVNSRPLVYVGDEIGPNSVITPAHFLSLKHSLGIPSLFGNVEHCDPDFLSRLSSVDCILQAWKKGQAIIDGFWTMWQREYLNYLRERSAHEATKKGTSRTIPCVNDIVLVGDELLPRGTWKLGRITEVWRSKDGHIRSASVLTPNQRILKRPVSLLYPIECPQPVCSEKAEKESSVPDTPSIETEIPRRPTRKTAQESREFVKLLQDNNLV